MKKLFLLFAFSFLMAGFLQINAQEKINPESTEVWEPVPPIITPGDNGNAPSDAIVLFNGKDLSQWLSKDGKDAKWKVENGILTVAPGTGAIVSRKDLEIASYI